MEKPVFKRKEFPEGRNLRRNSPQFGTRFYLNGHRYVYYENGKPKYYFAGRPYTLKDARKWKKGVLIGMGFCTPLLTAILIYILSLYSGQHNIFSILVCIMFLGMIVFGTHRFFSVLGLNPEEDPMLQSYQCTSDFQKPPEETCGYCGGVYSGGAHTVCPHCGALIGEQPVQQQ